MTTRSSKTKVQIDPAVQAAANTRIAQRKKTAEAASAKKEADKKKAKENSLAAQINNLTQRITALKTSMKTPSEQVSYYQEQMVRFVTDNPQPWNPGQVTEYNNYKKERDKNQTIVNGIQTTISGVEKQINALKGTQKNVSSPYNSATEDLKRLQSEYKKTSNKNNNTNNAAVNYQYYYNAPLVSSTNFKGIQAEVLQGNYITAGAYSDALLAFKIDKNSGDIITGRGTFQADRFTRNLLISGQINKTDSFKPDPYAYGFKFLYNPQTVSMSWGSLAMTDPTYVTTGKDPYSPGTSNLVSSTIDFSLLLNRIEDMQYLTKKGLDPNILRNPYPSIWVTPGKSFNDELAEIYEEGTMYDLKYLFRTMHSGGPYTSYKSMLTSKNTADPGFLPVRPIELHLGNSLRYRVRIASLSVNHTIFNARMVPLLTTVNISCYRYYDIQDVKKLGSLSTGG